MSCAFELHDLTKRSAAVAIALAVQAGFRVVLERFYRTADLV